MASLPGLPSVDMATIYPSLIMILSVLFFAGICYVVVVFTIRYMRYRDYKAYIWEFNDEGHLINISKDEGGIFYDSQTSSKLLFWRKNKTATNPDNIPFFYEGNKRVVYMVKKGMKNLHYINPKIKLEKLTLSVGEEDVNWAENAYERGIKMTSKPDRLMQILPYIIWALVIIGSLILVLKIVQKADVIVEAAKIAKDIAIENAKARATTVVME